ncbi:MAG: transporter substrate-binding domain-containing protein [Caulobacteraceae bacterium]
MIKIAPDLVRELAPGGQLKATINLGNVVLAQRHPQTGELGGVSVELARELAMRLGVEAELHPFETAGHAFKALQSGACDVGFLAIDPKRAEDLDYTAPYVIIEGTYMVADASPLREVEDVDREGVRIAAGENTAYDLHLTRALSHAKLVRYPSSAVAIDALFAGETDTVAGVRQALDQALSKHPGFRVMEGRFLVIEQAMALPKHRPQAHAFLRDFIEEMKASGFIADALARSGQGEATVAGPALR